MLSSYASEVNISTEANVHLGLQVKSSINRSTSGNILFPLWLISCFSKFIRPLLKSPPIMESEIINLGE